jgi:hypothetical protein
VKKVKSFLARVARRAITLTGGGMAVAGDENTALAGVLLVVAELVGRELMESIRERKEAQKFLVLVLAVGAAASATTAVARTFTWIPPTTYTNGLPLPPAELFAYDLTCNGAIVASGIPGGTNASAVVAFNVPGDYSCTLRAYDVFGNVSEPSNANAFTVPRANPSAATGLSSAE